MKPLFKRTLAVMLALSLIGIPVFAEQAPNDGVWNGDNDLTEYFHGPKFDDNWTPIEEDTIKLEAGSTVTVGYRTTGGLAASNIIKLSGDNVVDSISDLNYHYNAIPAYGSYQWEITVGDTLGTGIYAAQNSAIAIGYYNIWSIQVVKTHTITINYLDGTVATDYVTQTDNATGASYNVPVGNFVNASQEAVAGELFLANDLVLTEVAPEPEPEILDALDFNNGAAEFYLLNFAKDVPVNGNAEPAANYAGLGSGTVIAEALDPTIAAMLPYADARDVQLDYVYNNQTFMSGIDAKQGSQVPTGAEKVNGQYYWYVYLNDVGGVEPFIETNPEYSMADALTRAGYIGFTAEDIKFRPYTIKNENSVIHVDGYPVYKETEEIVKGYRVFYVDGVANERITMPVDTNQYAAGTEPVVTKTIPTRDGYTFSHWLLGEVEYRAEATLPPMTQDIELVAVWNENPPQPPEPTYYNLTVNWIDVNGTSLADTVTTNLEEGTEYTAEQKTFNDYTFLRAEGDTVSGVMNDNKTITFIYEITEEEPTPPPTPSGGTFSIDIEYVDTEGNEIANPYRSALYDDGEDYDVTDLATMDIAGYTYVESTGDALSDENNSSNIDIVSVYEVEVIDVEEPDVPLVDIPDTEPPLVDIPEVEPPLVDIPVIDVPLTEVPYTNDPMTMAFWASSAMASFASLGFLIKQGKKNDEK